MLTEPQQNNQRLTRYISHSLHPYGRKTGHLQNSCLNNLSISAKMKLTLLYYTLRKVAPAIFNNSLTWEQVSTIKYP